MIVFLLAGSMVARLGDADQFSHMSCEWQAALCRTTSSISSALTATATASSMYVFDSFCFPQHAHSIR